MIAAADAMALLDGLRQERDGFARMRALLQAHFDAALKHDSERVRVSAERITALTERLDSLCSQRQRLVQRLSGGATRDAHESLALRLPAKAADLLREQMRELQALVGECKRLNVRNCELVVGQQDIMARVLNDGTPGTYAPA